MLKSTRLFSFLIALACLSFLAAAAQAVDYDSQAYKAAYEQGRREAEQETAENRATIYLTGYGALYIGLDRATGLPCTAIAGCETDDAAAGRQEGHNERVGQFIKEHGLPSYSRKAWERELFDPKGYFDAKSEEQPPVRLTLNGPAVTSPDGKFALRLAGEPIEPGSADFRVWLVLKNAAGKEELHLPEGHEAARVTDLIWGPEGSDTAFLRWSDFRDPRYARYLPVHGSLDLRTGKRLIVMIEVQP